MDWPDARVAGKDLLGCPMLNPAPETVNDDTVVEAFAVNVAVIGAED